MNVPGEKALVQILLTYAPIAALVVDRVTWDDEEVDLAHPSVTLRTLTTRLPAAELRGRGGLRQCLVELAAHDITSAGASELLDHVIAALTPFDGTQSELELAGGGTVRLGGIQLQDVQQALSAQPRTYRKSATFSIWLYE